MLRTITRTAISGTIRLARLPLDAALKLSGRGGHDSEGEPSADRVRTRAEERTEMAEEAVAEQRAQAAERRRRARENAEKRRLKATDEPNASRTTEGEI